MQYKEARLETGYRIDLLVNDKVIVEVKAVKEHNVIYEAQLLTYLRLTNCHPGLLVNFNRSKMTEGIKRFVNNL